MGPTMVDLLDEDLRKEIWALTKLGLCIINNSYLIFNDFEP